MFLQETGVGRMVSLAALRGEKVVEDPVEVEGEEGQDPERMYLFFLCLFLGSSLFSLLFLVFGECGE